MGVGCDTSALSSEGDASMTNRRNVLKGLPWGAALVLNSAVEEAGSGVALEDECNGLAQKLAECLGKMHGCKWRVEVNHNAKFALIVPFHSSE